MKLYFEAKVLLGDLGVDEVMIIIIMLKYSCGLNSSVTEQGSIAGSYEHVSGNCGNSYKDARLKAVQ